MKLQPTIQTIPKKTLIGMPVTMSLTENKTSQLFRTFMPRKQEISHTINADIFDLRTYPEDYFLQFQPTATFTKWALAEVSEIENIPEGMEVFTLQGGLYAMFLYKGLSTDPTIFQYIFAEWLPKSDYLLDNRPHFEVLGEKAKLNDPNSEEEIWVPIRLKDK